MIQMIEWGGSILGMAGALLLALNIPISRFGWLFFAASNLCWIYYGIATGAWGLVTQQIVFTITSTIGIYQWIIRKPKIAGAAG